MVDSPVVCVVVGCCLGFLSGIGVGGGSLLVLWLTGVQNLPPETARSINLLFFLPSALIATFFRWQQGSLKLNEVFPAIIAGCVSAVLFSWIGSMINTNMLKKLFGILLIITGFRELFYKKKAS